MDLPVFLNDFTVKDSQNISMIIDHSKWVHTSKTKRLFIVCVVQLRLSVDWKSQTFGGSSFLNMKIQYFSSWCTFWLTEHLSVLDLCFKWLKLHLKKSLWALLWLWFSLFIIIWLFLYVKWIIINENKCELISPSVWNGRTQWKSVWLTWWRWGC